MFEFIAFDVETTGTLVERDEILEIAAVRFSNARPVDSFCSLVKPLGPIPEEATGVHGIDDEMVSNSPSLAEVLDNFAAFCRDSLLVAHNSRFDVKFLSAAIQSLETRSPTGLVLDTLGITKRAIPNLFSYRLGELVKEFNISASKFHRAEADAASCGQLFVKVVRRIATNGLLPPLENLVNLSGGELRFPQIEQRPKQMGLF